MKKIKIPACETPAPGKDPCDISCPFNFYNVCTYGYRISFRIRKIYFDQIVLGQKTVEVRRATKFWAVRMTRAATDLVRGIPVQAVFLCGRQVHRRQITSIEYYDNPQLVLGRLPTPTGLKDIGSGKVIGFHLGAEIKI